MVHVTFCTNGFKMAVFWWNLCPVSCVSFSMVVGSHSQKFDLERWGSELICCSGSCRYSKGKEPAEVRCLFVAFYASERYQTLTDVWVSLVSYSYQFEYLIELFGSSFAAHRSKLWSIYLGYVLSRLTPGRPAVNGVNIWLCLLLFLLDCTGKFPKAKYN